MKKFGHYEVTAELGRGGMGVVYKGWEPSLNRQVAIKCLGEHLLNDEDLVERFTREAKATAALNNPNVIQIYFIGKEKDVPFFAMEYIEGQSLDDILKGGNSLSVKHAKNLLKQACLGLAAAHKKDLVHRDIKPANLMLTTDGTLKIVDFGIARTREYGDKLTNTGEFVGTPGYLSPEVCIGQEVDQRSDIFSLGIVFYEMLAGKVPFENDSPLGLMLEVVQSDIPDIRELNKKVDKKTSFILNKMIAKSPDERYQSCEDVIRDLGNIADNETILAIKTNAKAMDHATTPKKNNVSENITLPSAVAITDKYLVNNTQQNKKSRKGWLIAATLFTLVAAAGVGYYGGYLPIGENKIDSSINSIASLAQDLSSETQPKLPEPIDTDSENNDNSLNDSNPQSKSGQGLLAGIGNMFSDEESQDVASLDNSGDLNIPTQPISTINSIDTKIAKIQTPTQAAEVANDIAESQVVIPTTLNSIAHNTPTDTGVAENRTQVLPINTVAAHSTKTVRNKPVIKTIPLNKGVVVIAFGDPAIANPVEKILESELKQQGVKVMNEQFIPGMRQLMSNGLDLAELKNLIERNGGQAMVIASINYVGSQQLQYAGRSSELINAQIDIDTYDIKSGDSIGKGYGTKINYTSLNATDQASDAVMQYTNTLIANLKSKI